MKIANGEIRAWETIKMTFSTYREKSGLFPDPQSRFFYMIAPTKERDIARVALRLIGFLAVDQIRVTRKAFDHISPGVLPEKATEL
jgi:hypothetical protein